MKIGSGGPLGVLEPSQFGELRPRGLHHLSLLALSGFKPRVQMQTQTALWPQGPDMCAWTPLLQLCWPWASHPVRSLDLASVIIFWHFGNHESPAGKGKQIQFVWTAVSLSALSALCLHCCVTGMPALWDADSPSAAAGCHPGAWRWETE